MAGTDSFRAPAETVLSALLCGGIALVAARWRRPRIWHWTAGVGGESWGAGSDLDLSSIGVVTYLEALGRADERARARRCCHDEVQCEQIIITVRRRSPVVRDVVLVVFPILSTPKLRGGAPQPDASRKPTRLKRCQPRATLSH